MEWERQRTYDFENGKEAGIAVGIQQKAVEDAINMLKKKYPISDIEEITGLAAEKVTELKKQITVNA